MSDKNLERAELAESFLVRLAAAGRPRQMIVSTGAMTPEGIAEARAEGRMLVLQNGLGFVICPLEVDLGPKRAIPPEALRIPEGWVLLPEAPTEEMIHAALHCLDGVDLSKMTRFSRNLFKVRQRWIAMRRAAPPINVLAAPSPEHRLSKPEDGALRTPEDTISVVSPRGTK